MVDVRFLRCANPSNEKRWKTDSFQFRRHEQADREPRERQRTGGARTPFKDSSILHPKAPTRIGVRIRGSQQEGHETHPSRILRFFVRTAPRRIGVGDSPQRTGGARTPFKDSSILHPEGAHKNRCGRFTPANRKATKHTLQGFFDSSSGRRPQESVWAIHPSEQEGHEPPSRILRFFIRKAPTRIGVGDSPQRTGGARTPFKDTSILHPEGAHKDRCERFAAANRKATKHTLLGFFDSSSGRRPQESVWAIHPSEQEGHEPPSRILGFFIRKAPTRIGMSDSPQRTG